MSRSLLRGLSLTLLLVTIACQKADKSSVAVVTGAGEDVDRAVAVTQGIRAHRAAADSVLAAHHMTAEGFDSLMYVIAADSAKAAAYRKAIE
jgi:hypothetical protein